MHNLIADIRHIFARPDPDTSNFVADMRQEVESAINEYYSNAHNIIRLNSPWKMTEEYISAADTSDTVEPSPEPNAVENWTVANIYEYL